MPSVGCVVKHSGGFITVDDMFVSYVEVWQLAVHANLHPGNHTPGVAISQFTLNHQDLVSDTYLIGLLVLFIFLLDSGQSSAVVTLGQLILNYEPRQELTSYPVQRRMFLLPLLYTWVQGYTWSKKWRTTRKGNLITIFTNRIPNAPQLKTSETTHHWLHDLESKFRTPSVYVVKIIYLWSTWMESATKQKYTFIR